MYLAQRTRTAVRTAFIVVVVYAAVVAALAWKFSESGSFSGSFWAWLLGIPVVLAIYGALEWSGRKFLSMPVWERLPAVVRVLLLVLLVAFATLAFMLAGEHWHA